MIPNFQPYVVELNLVSEGDPEVPYTRTLPVVAWGANGVAFVPDPETGILLRADQLEGFAGVVVQR